MGQRSGTPALNHSHLRRSSSPRNRHRSSTIITFAVDWIQALGLLIGVILPLLVSIASKLSTAPWVKAVALAGLAFATNFATELSHALTTNTPFNAGDALILGLGTFIIAVSASLGFWNPTKVTHNLMKKVGRKDNAVLGTTAETTDPPSAL